jgi:hypothetical protein
MAHQNSHIANCLRHAGRINEALNYQTLETQVYPISIIAYYNRMQLEKALGLRQRAEISAERLIYSLKLKGLSIGDLKRVLKNPELDGRFHELKHPKP